jgi:uncharacterized protein YgbK (DUF1537 family)
MTPPLLGCIADDFTGATDLANNLVRAGMRAVQTIGVPDAALELDADAVVVALKSRTIPAAEAVAQSLAALRWLQAQGARQIYFKYCSTFDSTDRGNIGPVTDALLAALGSDFTIACPAFPENKRSVFKGHLFAGDVPLNESGMQNHPLTPMTDANLVRVLQRQTTRKVGLVAYDVVALGAGAIRERFAALASQGVQIAVVDAISNDDLMKIGPALAGMPLVTAGSGIAVGLPQNWVATRELRGHERSDRLPAIDGLRAVISGSCSAATQGQVAAMIAAGAPAFRVDALELAAGKDLAAEALAWAAPRLASGPVLVYATANPEEVKAVQARLGVERAGRLVEDALAAIARGLVGLGVRRLIVAGGETSGAAVSALGVEALRIGPQIDPGVPWTASVQADPIALALKSGNFGTPDFFLKAWDALK